MAKWTTAEKKAYARAYYEANKDYWKKRYAENKEEHLANAKAWSQENREKRNAISAEWRSKNKEVLNLKRRARRSRNSHASPPWVDAQHMAGITYIYAWAKYASQVSGETYHVDHIYPLNGKTACGLHVLWNLTVLRGRENISKGNKLPEDLRHG